MNDPTIIAEAEIEGRTIADWAAELHARTAQARAEAMPLRPFPVVDLTDVPPAALRAVEAWVRAGQPSRRSRFEALLREKEHTAARFEEEATLAEKEALALDGAKGGAKSRAAAASEAARRRKDAARTRSRAAALRTEIAMLRESVA